MKRRDLNRIKASGESIKGKEAFLMPLVYFNSAKMSLELFRNAKDNFEVSRDWFVKKVQELQDSYEINKNKEVDDELIQYLEHWPDGMSLDIIGAFDEIHAPLAETIAHYFTFLTNCVASVESCVNLKLSILLGSGQITSNEIEDWKTNGVSDRAKRLLQSIDVKVLDVDTGKPLTRKNLDASLEIFNEVVRSRNQLVHHKSKPSEFTQFEIDLGKVTGVENIDEEFCLKAIDAIQIILSAISIDNNPWGDSIFIKQNIGFHPGWSPSPYIRRVVD